MSEIVKPGEATEEQRAALREMLARCDRPTEHQLLSTLSSEPKAKPRRGWWSSLRKALWPWKGL